MPYTHARETLIRLSGSSQLGAAHQQIQRGEADEDRPDHREPEPSATSGRGLYVFPGGDVIVERATHQGSEQGSRLLA